MESENQNTSNNGIPEKLQQQIEVIRKIATAQMCSYCVKDLTQKYLSVNTQFEKSLGLTSSQIINKRDADLSLNSANSHLHCCTDNTTIEIPLTDTEGETVAVATLFTSTQVAGLTEALKARDDQLTVLQSLMADLVTRPELDPLLQNISDMLTDYTIATQTLILLVDETAEFIQVVATSGTNSRKNLGARRERGVGFAGVAWDTATTQFIANSDHNNLTNGFWPSATQLLAVPLKVESEVIGVAVLGAPSDEIDFSGSTALVNYLANVASLAIATAKSWEQSKKELQHSRGISEIGRQLTSIENVDELLTTVSKTLVESFDFSRCTFFTVSEDGDLLSNTTWTTTESGIEAITTLPPEIIAESSCYWSYINVEDVIINRSVEDPRESVRIHKLRNALNIGCSVTMPVVVSGTVSAVLFICKHLHKPDCDENELNLLSSVVQQLSTAIYGIHISQALRQQAYHDSLTGLPNRRFFEEELKRQLHATPDSIGSLMFLDLDGFKTVNDTLGHASGDHLLQLVARRLERSIPSKGSIARIGGDEFAIIIPEINSEQEAFRLAQKIRKAVLDPFKIKDNTANIGTSIGLCFYPSHGESVDVLLRNADEAMYQAKTGGKNNVVCFEQFMSINAQKKIRIESELHAALARREFILHYQPQVDPIDGLVKGVEALVRWDHPERGMVPPSDFVPIAEETGLINEIGAWVLDEAVCQIDRWKNTRLSNLRVSVNIAASQFIFGDFSARVEQRLNQYDVQPSMLEVEITESVVMKDLNHVKERLMALGNLGVTVALDDFGTGYSSLSYLQELPIDVLKVDRAFVAALNNDSDYSIVNTIMLLASGLGLETVAEGIETKGQLDHLVELGCSLIQGYYYSRPCGVKELEDVVRKIEDTPRLRLVS